jgi:sulfur carrier protein
MINITVNGKTDAIDPGLTLLGYLEKRGINPAMIVVEHNGELPDRESWGQVILQTNDRLELIKFMGGG